MVAGFASETACSAPGVRTTSPDHVDESQNSTDLNMESPMSNLFTHSRRPALFRQRGQGMTEYIIIVALIAIGAIAVYTYFGNTVREQTAAIAQELSGTDGSATSAAAQTQAGRAAVDANTSRNLSTYSGNVNK